MPQSETDLFIGVCIVECILVSDITLSACKLSVQQIEQITGRNTE